ncbi:MAG: septal ring lytic transglycosylase RlpA family protein [Alphaproteobacteria bacterium]|nr:septal ring lytic transglycosylase RlpA family protein [Alphaproteobacteria bacterium]
MAFISKSMGVLAGVMSLAVIGCAEVGHAPPPGPGARPVPPPASRAARPAAPACVPARAFRQEGTASWYGRPYHGRRTASGQIYNMHDFTAAHRNLPFGSRIRVTNKRNGRSVLVTVNDRGPFIRGRIVDLSYRAARALQFVRAGLVPVRIERVGRCPARQSAASDAQPSPGR